MRQFSHEDEHAGWPEFFALTAATLTATLAARGILGGQHAVVRLLAAGAAMHLVAWSCRRRRIPGGFFLAIGAFIAVVGWLALPGSTFFGIPTIRTLLDAISGISRGITALDTRLPLGVREPAVVMKGRLVFAVAFVAGCALLAEIAAFSSQNPAVALLPSFSLLLTGATQAPLAHPAPEVALYLAAAFAFLFIHHTQQAAAIDGQRRAGLRATVPVAAGLTTLAIGAALLFAPLLPGYGSPALITSQRVRPTVISSLVDIADTIQKLDATEMFSVATAQPSYWRLTALDSFDGRVWSQSGQPDNSYYGVDRGPLDTSAQDFHIEALQSDYLPAAYQVQAVDGGSVQIIRGAFDSLVPVGPETPGMQYRVTSEIPVPTPAQLGNGYSQAGLSAALGRYLALPQNLSSRVVQEALRVTAPARSEGPYFAAQALQNYFRTNFTYDLTAANGQSDDALVEFLFTTRRGFCEQFAGAFAVMARAVGLPTRVAIGFTSGQLEPDGRYHVLGLNAHAWPEVYLAGVGWVGFEPTPGRDMPGAAGDSSPAVAPPLTAPATTTPAPTGTGPGGTAGTGGTGGTGGTPTIVPLPGGQLSPATTVAPGTGTARPGSKRPAGGSRSSGTVKWLLVVAVAVAALTGMTVLNGLRRRSQRWRVNGANDRVVAAWSTASEALRDFGLGRQPAETMLTHAKRAATDIRLPKPLAEPILALAGHAGAALYSEREVPEQQVAEADQAAADIRTGLDRATPAYRRIGRLFIPRRPRRP